jgi:hypothetical protein
MEGATSPPNGSASQLVSPGRLPANSALTPGTPVSGATGGVVPPKAREGVPSPNTASALGSPPLSGSALFAQTGIAVGVLPAPTPVAALGAMHGVNHLQYSGALGWAFAQTSHSSKDPSKGARVRLGFAAMQVGYAWLERSLELGVHTSALAGVMAAVSTGVDNRQSGLGPYAALGMGLSVALSRWAALFTVDGWMSYLSPDFQVADLGRVYQPGPFGGILGVGLRGRLK